MQKCLFGIVPKNLYSLKAPKPFRKPLEPNISYKYQQTGRGIYFYDPGKNWKCKNSDCTLLGAPLGAPNRGELLFRIRSRVFFAQVEIISYPATGLMYIFGKILTAVKAIP